MKSAGLFLVILLMAVQLRAQNNLALAGHLPYPNHTCAGIWHYVDTLGNEYALVGVDDRVAIVDVTTPSALTEVFSVPALPGQSSLWREIKTEGKYAYAVSEGGGGVIIIDLSNLPAGISHKHYYGDGAILNQITSAHTIAVTDGYAYVFGTGGGLANGGAIILDLTDPWNPEYVGQYNLQYIHDGYIRNDTLWAGEIYAGQFSVIDVSDKTNPVLMATQATPGNFCHNTWLSDNSHFLFTTDEIGGEPLGSFDVTDLQNIQLVDEYFTDSMPQEEVHNVRVLNDFLINPSYGSQLTICDAARPDNIVEIGRYPTGNFLCWDASPYLPSGRIIAADTDGGVFVFDPTYQRACYLEGIVSDSLTGLPLNNVQVEILQQGKKSRSDLSGSYKTGNAQPGTFDILFKKQGYSQKIIQGVTLNTGQLTTLNVQLPPFELSGTVTDNVSGNPIPGALVFANDGNQTATATADANGNFNFTTLVNGSIDITATKWGFNSYCQTLTINYSTPVNIVLNKGYYDDFVTDLGWTINSTASAGIWERCEPVGTTYATMQINPEVDVNTDCSEFAYVTGNAGGAANNDNVDNGYTELVSPLFDALTDYTNPVIEYYRWFSSPMNVPAGNRDTLFVFLSNGVNIVELENVTNSTPGNGSWVQSSFALNGLITPTATMSLLVYISDKPGSGNIVEGGLDLFRVIEGVQSTQEIKNQLSFLVYPNPGAGPFTLQWNGASILPDAYEITDISGRRITHQPVREYPVQIQQEELKNDGIYFVNLLKQGKLVSSSKLVRQGTSNR